MFKNISNFVWDITDIKTMDVAVMHATDRQLQKTRSGKKSLQAEMGLELKIYCCSVLLACIADKI